MEEEGDEDRFPPSVAREGLLRSDHVRDGDIYPRPLYRPHRPSLCFQLIIISYFLRTLALFQGGSQIDVIKRRLWKTCGFRAGGVVPMSPSVGVMSSYGNQAFSSFAIMVVSPIAFSSGPLVSLPYSGDLCASRKYLCFSMTPQRIFRCDREILRLHLGTWTH